MGIFKSKQEKEIEKKMMVKKTINAMNRHINKLEEQKKVYVEAAKRATRLGLAPQVNLAKSGLKMTLAQCKKAQEMLLNFEITSQMKDMSLMTQEFLNGMSSLSKEMVKLTDSKDFVKVQKQFEMAMSGVETRTEQMDLFLDENQSTFSTASGDSSQISDAEIDSLINEQASQQDISDDTIDSVLTDLKNKMKA